MIFALVHGGEYSPSHLFVWASFSVIILSSTFEQRFRGWSSTRVMFVACSKPFTSVGGAPMGGRVFFANHGILAERAAVSGPLNVALMHRRASLDIPLCSCGDSGQSM